MTIILSKLKGGDRRSIGNVNAVVAAVGKRPGFFKDLVSGLFDPDPIMRMRKIASQTEKSSSNTVQNERDLNHSHF
jgi:hypothetical protein